MFPRVLIAVCLLSLCCPAAVLAQDENEDEKVFQLQPKPTAEEKEELAAQEAERFEPGIRAGHLETSLLLGFIDLNTTLLSHDQMVYRWTSEEKFWGDVELVGESAFHPVLSLNYNLTTWFALEPSLSMSVSEYQGEIVNRSVQKHGEGEEPAPEEPELEDFHPEHRSVMTLGAGLNGLLYPLNFLGDGKGRFHPYLSGGATYTSVDLNSNYTDDPWIGWDMHGGLGLRFVADDLISIRAEVIYHSMTIDFEPAVFFEELEAGSIPLYQYVPSEGSVSGVDEVPVQEFESHSLNSLAWSLGFIATF